MEFFAHPIIAIILLLGLLIIVHELGHFLVGKACGIAVEIFSIGFGPVLFSVQRRETNYRLSLIPLGGFVKFYGASCREDVPEELQGKEFYKAAVWKRILTVLAGPGANFLLAIVAYMGMGMHGIPHPPPVVGEVMRGSPAEKAGLQFQDRIVAIGDEPVTNWHELQQIVVKSPDQALRFTVKRGEKLESIVIRPEEIKDEEMIGRKTRGQIGISPGYVPSAITITDPGAIFSKAGVKTGDYISSVSFAGETHAINSWREFTAVLANVPPDANLAIAVTKDDKTFLEVSSPASTVASGVDQALSTWGISHSQLTVGETESGIKNDLLPGDKIIAISNTEIHDLFQFRDAILANQTPSITAEILREGKKLKVPVTMKPVEIQKAGGKATFYSFPVTFLAQLEQPEPVIERYLNPLRALWFGVTQTASQTGMIAVAVAGLFTGDMPLEALGGPISIAKVASDSVKMGWLSFVSALSLISINLGLLNLFPIPVLDGGQLVLLAVEGVRRRPLGEIAIENFQKIGFVMVLALVAMATYNDLSRFWSSMLKGVVDFFQ